MRARTAAAGALLASLAGCSAPPPPPPPACPTVPEARGAMVPTEKPPVSSSKLTLEPGDWEWTGTAFVWSPPRWVALPPGTGTLWQPGFWTMAPGGCAWTPGRFIS